jgi:hypothetical protein
MIRPKNSEIVNSQEYINNTLDKLQYIYGTIEIRMRQKPNRYTQLEFHKSSALPSLTRGVEWALRRTDDRWLGVAEMRCSRLSCTVHRRESRKKGTNRDEAVGQANTRYGE